MWAGRSYSTNRFICYRSVSFGQERPHSSGKISKLSLILPDKCGRSSPLLAIRNRPVANKAMSTIWSLELHQNNNAYNICILYISVAIPFTCFCESWDECLSMLLLLLTALAVSFRTCCRKLIIPAIGQKEKYYLNCKCQLVQAMNKKQTGQT